MNSPPPASGQQPPTKRRKLSSTMLSPPHPGLLTPELRAGAAEVGRTGSTAAFSSHVQLLSESEHPIHVQHLSLCHAVRNLPSSIAPSAALALLSDVLLDVPYAASNARYVAHLASALFPCVIRCTNDHLSSFITALPYRTRTLMLAQLTRSARPDHAGVFDALFASLRCTFGIRQAVRILPACSGAVVRDALAQFKPCFTNDMSWRLLCRRHTDVIASLLFTDDADMGGDMWTHSARYMPPSDVLAHLLSVTSTPPRYAFTKYVLGTPNALQMIANDASNTTLQALFVQTFPYSREYYRPPDKEPGPTIQTLLRRATHDFRLSLLRRLHVVVGADSDEPLKVLMSASPPSSRLELFSTWFPSTVDGYAHTEVVSLLPAPARYPYLPPPSENVEIHKRDTFLRLGDPDHTWSVSTDALGAAEADERAEVASMMSQSVCNNRAKKGYLEKVFSLFCNRVKTDDEYVMERVMRDVSKWPVSVWELGWSVAVERSLDDLIGYAMRQWEERIVESWYCTCVALFSQDKHLAILKWAERTLQLMLRGKNAHVLSFNPPFPNLPIAAKQKLRAIIIPFAKACVDKGKWKAVGDAVRTYRLPVSFIDTVLDRLVGVDDPKEIHQSTAPTLFEERLRHPVSESRLSTLLATDPSLLRCTPLWSYVTSRMPHLLLQDEVVKGVLNKGIVQNGLFATSNGDGGRWGRPNNTEAKVFLQPEVSRTVYQNMPTSAFKLLKQHVMSALCGEWMSDKIYMIGYAPHNNPALQAKDVVEICKAWMSNRPKEDAGSDDGEGYQEEDIDEEQVEEEEENAEEEEAENNESMDMAKPDEEVSATPVPHIPPPLSEAPENVPNIPPPHHPSLMPVSSNPFNQGRSSSSTDSFDSSQSVPSAAKFKGIFASLNELSGNLRASTFTNALLSLPSAELEDLPFRLVHAESRLSFDVYGALQRLFSTVSSSEVVQTVHDEILAYRNKRNDKDSRAGRIGLIKIAIHALLSGRYVPIAEGLCIVQKILQDDEHAFSATKEDEIELNEEKQGVRDGEGGDQGDEENDTNKDLGENEEDDDDQTEQEKQKGKARNMKPASMHIDARLFIVRTAVIAMSTETPDWIWRLLGDEGSKSVTKASMMIDILVRLGSETGTRPRVLNALQNIADRHATNVRIQAELTSGMLALMSGGGSAAAESVLNIVVRSLRSVEASQDNVDTLVRSLWQVARAAGNLQQVQTGIVSLVTELIGHVESDEMHSGESAKWFVRLSTIVGKLSSNNDERGGNDYYHLQYISRRYGTDEISLASEDVPTTSRRQQVVDAVLSILDKHRSTVPALGTLCVLVRARSLDLTSGDVVVIARNIRVIGEAESKLICTGGSEEIAIQFGRSKISVLHIAQDVVEAILNIGTTEEKEWALEVAYSLVRVVGRWHSWPDRMKTVVKTLRQCQDERVAFNSLSLQF